MNMDYTYTKGDREARNYKDRPFGRGSHLFVRLSDFVQPSGPEWANGSSIWNSRSKLSRRSALEIDVMSARTGQDTGPYYAYNRVSSNRHLLLHPAPGFLPYERLFYR